MDGEEEPQSSDIQTKDKIELLPWTLMSVVIEDSRKLSQENDFVDQFFALYDETYKQELPENTCQIKDNSVEHRLF